MAPKRTNDDYLTDDISVSDENSDGASAKRSKKAKVEKPRSTDNSTNGPQRDDEGGVYWEISKNRRVTVNDFKGKTMISVREYYEKDGKTLPGRKGITLNMDQYAKLINILPDIETALIDRKETVPRPEYDAASATQKAAENEGVKDPEEKAGSTKPNFAATDDESEEE